MYGSCRKPIIMIHGLVISAATPQLLLQPYGTYAGLYIYPGYIQRCNFFWSSQGMETVVLEPIKNYCVHFCNYYAFFCFLY